MPAAENAFNQLDEPMCVRCDKPEIDGVHQAAYEDGGHSFQAGKSSKWTHEPVFTSLQGDEVVIVADADFERLNEIEAAAWDAKYALLVVIQETERCTFGKPNYDMTMDHLHDTARVALDRLHEACGPVSDSEPRMQVVDLTPCVLNGCQPDDHHCGAEPLNSLNGSHRPGETQ